VRSRARERTIASVAIANEPPRFVALRVSSPGDDDAREKKRVVSE
jgi:hypothetical protein